MPVLQSYFKFFVRNSLINKNNSPNLTVDFEITTLLGKHDFDRINELATLLCHVPGSIISLVSDKGKIYNFPFGPPDVHHSDIDEIGRHVLNNGEFFEIEDTLNDDRFKKVISTGTDLPVRFYAGFPITDKLRKISGVLSVLD